MTVERSWHFGPRAGASLLMLVLALTGCGGGSSSPAPLRLGVSASGAQSSAYVGHVVIIVQENRSFDDLFATFPGADGATFGYTSKGKRVMLKKQPLRGLDINHDYKTYRLEWDDGKMDGFNLAGIGGNNPASSYPYQYVDPAQIKPYWTLAQQYGLADYMFQTQGSGSFTAHQDLIAGGTTIDQGTAPLGNLIDYPSNWTDWSCDAPPSTTTPYIEPDGTYVLNGPFPCITYPTGTMRDTLDEKHVSWRYYAPAYDPDSVGAMWNAFAAIDAVRHDQVEWKTNISTPEKNIFKDIKKGKLKAVSWVIPDEVNSDHPGWPPPVGPDHGPSWVAQVVNAVGESPYWNSTAIVVLWDDWGGFFDHEPPPQILPDGLGFRVPMIVVSPYVPAGEISHTQYEFGSVLKFVEETFGLRSLGTSDARATSISNMFDFNQAPRTFTPIPAEKSRAYFLEQPPSNVPVDRE